MRRTTSISLHSSFKRYFFFQSLKRSARYTARSDAQHKFCSPSSVLADNCGSRAETPSAKSRVPCCRPIQYGGTITLKAPVPSAKCPVADLFSMTGLKPLSTGARRLQKQDARVRTDVRLRHQRPNCSLPLGQVCPKLTPYGSGQYSAVQFAVAKRTRARQTSKDVQADICELNYVMNAIVC